MATRRARIGWQVLVFLLGAEAAILLVWLGSGIEYGGHPWFDGGQWSEPVKALLEIVPLLTILVALRLGWVERRHQAVRWLVGLALVGPVLFAASLLATGLSNASLGRELLRLSTWIATPACTAAAAGLVAALRGCPGRGCVLLGCGAVAGFLAISLPMSALGIGSVAACPAWCDPLLMRGLEATAIVIGVIGLVMMTPGFVVGLLIGRRLRDP